MKTSGSMRGRLVLLLAVAASPICADSIDLGNGYRDHGVAVPISNHRGTVATVDGNGRNIVLQWLMDHRGGYSLLLLDAETGKSEQFDPPFPPAGEIVDSPYAVLLSSGNRFYTHFHNRFVEFDPVKRAITFCSEDTSGRFAMGMTEDDNGVIWAVSYPQSGVTSFDPRTRAFVDYGDVYTQDWLQYQFHVAADDAGWIYFGIGHAASQIIAFDPSTGKATPMVDESQRRNGMAYVYRDVDGNVYGQALKDEDGGWIRFHAGKAEKIGSHDAMDPKPIITGRQSLFHATFPDGSRIASCNLTDRILTIAEAGTGAKRELPFDYDSDGATIMGATLAPDGTVCGGTTFPMRVFNFDAAADSFSHRPSYGQWNIVRTFGGSFYAGTYPGGNLLEWQPSKPWAATDPKKEGSNPARLAGCTPTIHRPSQLLVTRDEKIVLMGGTPDYGLTGGGLLIWNKEQRTDKLLKDTDVVADQSTLSMIELADGKVLAGTTTAPGTGGEKKATEALLYVIDPHTAEIEWREAVLPGTQEYTDLHMPSADVVYGIADRTTFFTFDPATRKVVTKHDVDESWGRAAYHQGPRVFIPGADGELYLLFTKGIARFDGAAGKPALLSNSPLPVDTGGAYLDGRIYFTSGSHLISCELSRTSLQTANQ